MASTWYFDLANNKDLNNGTSFSQRAKQLATAAKLPAARDTDTQAGTTEAHKPKPARQLPLAHLEEEAQHE